MKCTRRNFLTGAGAVIFTTGSVSILKSTNLKADEITKNKRYGLIYDEAVCIGCNACVDACRETNKVPESVSRLDIFRSEPKGEYPDVKYSFARKSCQQCENAPCVYVCPTGATYKDTETGIVDVNKDKCVGCGYCLAACPYQVPFFHPINKSADKCNFCRDTNLAQGKQPACVESCPTKALVFGDLNDPKSEINQELENKAIYRDKAHLGTEPKVYKVG